MTDFDMEIAGRIPRATKPFSVPNWFDMKPYIIVGKRCWAFDYRRWIADGHTAIIPIRAIYAAYMQDDAYGFELHHPCQNGPWCVNPHHLMAVTSSEHRRIHFNIKISGRKPFLETELLSLIQVESTVKVRKAEKVKNSVGILTRKDAKGGRMVIMSGIKTKETFSIDPELAKQAKEFARQQNRSFSSLVRHALLIYLQEFQESEKNRKVLRAGER